MQCRERYENILNPNISKEEFSAEEDKLLLELYAKYPNKWSEIARNFKFEESEAGEGCRRTDNQIKRRYKRLSNQLLR